MPKSMTYSAGSIVYFEGDKDEFIYIVQSGMIVLKSLVLDNGVQQSENLRTGEFFGVKSALARMPRTETASVACDSVVLQFTVPEFEHIFSSKLDIIEKMLRVFSNSLRLIHQQTEKILNKKTETTSSGQGMFAVANAFYNDEEYHISCEILNKVLEKFSSEVNVEQVKALLKDAKLKAEQQAHNDRMLTYSNDYTPATSSVLKQFSLPAFDRFTKNYKKGDVIVAEYEPGEAFYLIKSGEVQIVKTMNTQNKNLDVLKPGEFFGEMAILDNSPRTATCVAKTNVSCLEFNKANFSSLVLGNSVIVMNLLKLFCKRICDQRRRIKIILIPDISVRIADVFIMFDELNKISNIRDELNHKRKFDLTVGEISSWAGISINDARDELNKLVEKRKIEIFDNFMIVSNIHDMKRTVDSYYKKLNEALKNSSVAK